MKVLLMVRMPLLAEVVLNWIARWIHGPIHFDSIVAYFTPMKFETRFTEPFNPMSITNGKAAIYGFVFESIHCSDYAIL